MMYKGEYHTCIYIVTIAQLCENYHNNYSDTFYYTHIIYVRAIKVENNEV